MKYFVKRKNIIEHFAHEIAKLQWKADNFYNDGNKEMSSYILSKSDALMKLASNIGIGKEVYIQSIEIYDYRNSGRGGRWQMKNCTGANCPMQYGSVDTATDPATCVAVKECIFATPPKTNADCIRGMSDEELAEFLCDIIVDRYIGVTAEGWLEWLRKAEEGET